MSGMEMGIRGKQKGGEHTKATTATSPKSPARVWKIQSCHTGELLTASHQSAAFLSPCDAIATTEGDAMDSQREAPLREAQEELEGARSTRRRRRGGEGRSSRPPAKRCSNRKQRRLPAFFFIYSVIHRQHRVQPVSPPPARVNRAHLHPRVKPTDRALPNRLPTQPVTPRIGPFFLMGPPGGLQAHTAQYFYFSTLKQIININVRKMDILLKK